MRLDGRQRLRARRLRARGLRKRGRRTRGDTGESCMMTMTTMMTQMMADEEGCSLLRLVRALRMAFMVIDKRTIIRNVLCLC
jgi:hypothetical protein